MYRPDARIGTRLAGPFAGDNVYSSTGAGETKTISVKRGKKATLYADFQNDSLFPDDLTVHGTGAARGFSISYFNGTGDVTAKVKAGTWDTLVIAPGRHLTLKVVIKVAASSRSKATFLVTVKSFHGELDAVKVIVNAK